MDVNVKCNTDWEVLTDYGFKSFDGVKKINKNFYFKIEYKHNNNINTIKCSSNHKIKLNNGIFVYAKDITINDIIYKNKIITNIQYVEEDIILYDLLNVSDCAEYITNDITSHNCAFIPNMTTLWIALQPTLSTGGEIIVLSSPGGVGNWFHKTYVDAEENKNDFNPIKLDWRVHPERDDNWRKQQDIDLGELEAKQEYDASFIGTGNSIIDDKYLQFYKENYVTDPIKKEYNDLLWIWSEPKEESRYLISADVGRGDGGDFSAFHVIDMDTFEQIAEYEGKISTTDYAYLLFEVGNRYNCAKIACENASIGWAVVQELINLNYGNLYYTETNLKYIDEYNIQDLQNKLIDFNKKKQLIPGFTTSSSTRPLIINKLMECMRQQTVVIKSNRTINQLHTFVWHNSKAEALSGFNDDIVMSLSIGLYVRDVILQLDNKSVEKSKSILSNISLNFNKNREQFTQKINNGMVGNPMYKTGQKTNTGKEFINLSEFL